jgi:hypothetical protein
VVVVVLLMAMTATKGSLWMQLVLVLQGADAHWLAAQ